MSDPRLWPNLDNDTVQRLAAELEQKTQPLDMTFTRAVVPLQLAGLLQLALRHPGITPSLRETATKFVAGVRIYFGDCPTVLAVLDAGDDPRQDVS